MKRPLVVRLVALLLAILLAGCAASPSPTEPSNEAATEMQAEATGAITATEIEITDTTVEATAHSTIPAVVTEATVPTETTMPPETMETTVPDTTAETIAPTTAPTEAPAVTEPVEEVNLTPTQRNSINMLNYITVLTQAINESSGSRVLLESVKSSLFSNIYPNSVDTKTQSQINNLWRTIDAYSMIAVKRDRLEYIYEQNRAQALRQAIPNPLSLLSAVQSGSILKGAVSVLWNC